MISCKTLIVSVLILVVSALTCNGCVTRRWHKCETPTSTAIKVKPGISMNKKYDKLTRSFYKTFMELLKKRRASSKQVIKQVIKQVEKKRGFILSTPLYQTTTELPTTITTTVLSKYAGTAKSNTLTDKIISLLRYVDNRGASKKIEDPTVETNGIEIDDFEDEQPSIEPRPNIWANTVDQRNVRRIDEILRHLLLPQGNPSQEYPSREISSQK